VAESGNVVTLYAAAEAQEPIPLSPIAIQTLFRHTLDGMVPDYYVRHENYWKCLVAGVIFEGHQKSFREKLHRVLKSNLKTEEIRIAYTVILWFGTSLGNKFLDDALRPNPSRGPGLEEQWRLVNEDLSAAHLGKPMINWIFHQCDPECFALKPGKSTGAWDHRVLPVSQRHWEVARAVMSWLEKPEGRAFLGTFGRLVNSRWYAFA
jgi:hypothetical protein